MLRPGSEQQGYCMRCAFQFERRHLREDGRLKNLLVCAKCWDPDHPLDYPAPPRSEGMPPLKPSLIDAIDTAPVLSINREGSRLGFSWTAAELGDSMVRTYTLYLSLDGEVYTEFETGSNVYSTFGVIVTEYLETTNQYAVVSAPAQFWAYVVADDEGGNSVASAVETIEIETLEPELVFAVPRGATAASGDATLTIDPALETVMMAGDTMIWIGHASAGNGNPTVPPTTVTLPSGWRKLTRNRTLTVTDVIGLFVGNNRMVYSMWKTYSPGDVFTFIANHATEPHVEGVLYIVRGLRAVNPVSYMHFRAINQVNAFLGYVSSPGLNANEAGSLVVMQASCRGAVNVFAGSTFSEEPFSHGGVNTNIAGGTNRVWSDYYAAWNVNNNEIDNLFAAAREGGFNTAAWTKTNMGNISVLDQGWGIRTVFSGVDTGNVEHCVYQDVTLVADQPYSILVQGNFSTAADATFCIRVENGAEISQALFTDEIVGNMRAAATISGNCTFAAYPEGPRLNGNSFDRLWMTFVPAASGTYRVKFGNAKSGSLTYTGTGSSLALKAAVLCAGSHFHGQHHPSLIGAANNGPAITGGAGTRNKIMIPPGLPAVGMGVVFEACGQEPVASKIVHTLNAQRPQTGNPVSTSLTGWTSNSTQVMRLDRHIFPTAWGGPGKFHVEMTWPDGIDAVSSSTSMAPCMLICPLDAFSEYLSFSGQAIPAGAYGMSSRSTSSALGKVDDGTVSAWTNTTGMTVSTTLSLSIDYDAGTVVMRAVSATRDESITLNLAAVDVPYILVVNPGGHGTSMSIYNSTINTTGPFLQKPVGYSAWDWENEVA